MPKGFFVDGMESILLVEDKSELREMLVHALTRMQFRPVAAAGLEEALVQLRRQRFSAVLTDLKLPSGSGLDVLKAALDDDPAVPVIIMTAYGTIAQAVSAMREGAYDFIQKPIDLDDYARAHAELPDIAKKLIDDNGDVIRDRFLFAPADPYPAFYGSRAA